VGSQLRVLLFVESKRHLVSSDEDRPFDQIRLLHHQVDRFFLGPRKRALFEHRAAGADEVEKTPFVDVSFQELPVRWIFVDVSFDDLDLSLIQKTSGVTAGRSGRFPEEGWLCHGGIVDR
jgi:hypothetical protein